MNNKAVKITSLLMTLALVGFIGSVVYSLIPPQLSLALPDNIAWEIDTENGTMYLTADTTVTNNGFYPIDNLTIGLELENSTGFLLVAAETIPVNIPAGSSEPIPIRLPINLTQILLSEGSQNMFTSDTMNLTLFFSAAYAFQIFRINVGLTTQQPWIGPLANLSMSLLDTDVTFDDEIKLSALIETTHDGWLSLPNVPINITASLANGTIIGSGINLISIAPTPQSTLANFMIHEGYETLLLLENQSLNIDASLDFNSSQIGFQEGYSWGAPLYGLTLTTPNFPLPNNGTHELIQTMLNATNYSPSVFGINATISVNQSGMHHGSNETQGIFIMGSLTSIPILVYLTPYLASGSFTISVRLNDPLDILVLEQTFTNP